MPIPTAKHPPGLVPVGQIVTTFGLKGQVKVQPLTNIPSRLAAGKSLTLNGAMIKVEESRIDKGRYVLRLEGVKKIEQAEALKWAYLYVSEDEKPDLEDDEYLVDDLLGMKVVDQDGNDLGKVEEVLEYPAHDLLVVGELMIPAVDEFVTLVDFDAETIHVNVIEGLIESTVEPE